MPDFVTANTGDGAIVLADGSGGYLPAVYVAAGAQPMNVITADLDGDGHADVATANFGDDTVSVLLGRGDGTFATATRIPTCWSSTTTASIR